RYHQKETKETGVKMKEIHLVIEGFGMKQKYACADKEREKNSKERFFLPLQTKSFQNCKQNKVYFHFNCHINFFLKKPVTEGAGVQTSNKKNFTSSQKKKKKEKYVLIKLSDDEPVTFKPGSGQMADELSKEENWKLLQQATKHGLNLTDMSSFLFVKKKSNNAQINDGNDFMHVWNELIQSKQARYYTFKMKKKKKKKIYIHFIKKKLNSGAYEGKRTTWCPKNSNEPRFYQELEKEDWGKHLQEFKALTGISDYQNNENGEYNAYNEYSLGDEKKGKVVIKTGEDLKNIWKSLYDEDSRKWSLQLKVADQKIEDTLEDEKTETVDKRVFTTTTTTTKNNNLYLSDNKELEEKKKQSKTLEKEEEKSVIGEIKAGINLQGYCKNKECLAGKAKISVWMNLEFGEISLDSNNISYSCPVCKQLTLTSVIKALFFNSEHSIYASDGSSHENDYNYQRSYPIQSGLKYTLKANKIRQHAESIEDLRDRSEKAMMSNDIINLVAELQKHEITVVRPPSLKGNERLSEKIKADYGGDHNQVFDVGRFTILCENKVKLQTAVTVMKKAEQFHLIVSEDKDFFEKQSKTHHRFHNIKLYVPKYDVYIEMQATLKNFTTLEGYTIIENPKLSHIFYEHIRAWQPKNAEEEDLKQASDEALTKMNDIICEWIDDKGIQKLATRYKPPLDIGILKPSQLHKKSEIEINNNVPLKIAQFTYEQLCKFTPEKVKGKGMYVILYEYYKKYIIGDKHPASCHDFALLLQESMKQELKEDIATSQALETYIPLQANKYPYTDGDNHEKQNTFNCHQHVITFLNEEEEKNEQKENKVMIIQGKSGSGKSIFCRYLEKTLWNNYASDSKKAIPVYISFTKFYNKQNEKDIILQALQGRHINKESMDAIREKVPFVFIMDGFDEIFDVYSQNHNENESYFYDRFNLNQWNAKVIVTCRSSALKEEDIKTCLIGNNNQNHISMMYLWPFTKIQMRDYIDKFAAMKTNNNNNSNNNNWTSQQYEETLNNYPNLQKMVEEPFLLRLILDVLPLLQKNYDKNTRISRAQVYQVFNDQWINNHAQNIILKLKELKVQMSINKLKSVLERYCLDLGFDMFFEEKQIITELNMDVDVNDFQNVDVDKWQRYFNGDSIAKYVLRKVGDNKYQFLHKSCQEYYAAQKILFNIISWNDNNQLYINQLYINQKLLNTELSIIQFIADRIYDQSQQFSHLIQKLFQIIQLSKNNPNISIAAANAATILNAANVSMSYQNWDNICIPHAILDKAFLEGTTFKGAILDHVSFFQACLNNTNFTNASTNSINFGESYLQGHSNSVTSVGFSPDGFKIVSGSRDKTVRIWDVSSGKQIKSLEGHSNIIHSAGFSPDGSKIVSGSQDKTIRIWDVSSGEQIQLLKEHSSIVASVGFSPDGSKIVSGSSDTTIRIWDVSSGELIRSLNGHSRLVSFVGFFPDGSKIVSGSYDNTIRIWDVSSGEQIQLLKGHSNIITSVGFSPDGSKIVSGSYDKAIRIWDVSSGELIRQLEGHSEGITSVKFSPDGSKIVSGSLDKTVQIWDVSSRKLIQKLEGHSHWVNSVGFSPDGSKIVSGSFDKSIRIWNVPFRKLTQSLEGHSDAVRSVNFFSDGSKVVSGSQDNTIRIWDVSSGELVRSLEGHSSWVLFVGFSPDSSKIVSGSCDKTIRIWDVSSGKLIQLLNGHSESISSIKFSPDGSKIVSGSFDKTIRIWDVSSGELIRSLKGHSDTVYSVDFFPDGSKIVSGSLDKTLRIWDVSSGELMKKLEGHSACINSVKLSLDGSKIVSGSDDDTIRIWDASSGEEVQLLEGHSNYIASVEFSPDGSKIVSGSWDKTIRIWDVSSGKLIQTLEGHSDFIYVVGFSLDGSKIVSASRDKTIRIWNVSSEKLLRPLEGHSHWFNSVDFSFDGYKIVSGSFDKTIQIWDVSSGKLIRSWNGHSKSVTSVGFSPDGSKIVSGSRDKTIRIWDVSSGELIRHWKDIQILLFCCVLS
ncbi:NB-ARC domain-containing protein, partial [Reticulomyxa filosa]